MLTIKGICKKYGVSQAALARRFGIPIRTIEDWYAGRRNPPPYVISMIQELLELDNQSEGGKKES